MFVVVAGWERRGSVCKEKCIWQLAKFSWGVDMKGSLRLDDDGSSFSVRPGLVLIWPSAFSPGYWTLREPWDFQSGWRTKGQMGQAGRAVGKRTREVGFE